MLRNLDGKTASTLRSVPVLLWGLHFVSSSFGSSGLGTVVSLVLWLFCSH